METKRKFNIVDIVLLVLAAAVVIGVFALRNRVTGADASRSTVPMRCTVEMTWAPEDMANQMKVGDDVYHSTDSKYIGKVVSVRAVPHIENNYSWAQGRFIRYESEDGYDIYLTIEGDGYTTGRDVVIGEVKPKICGEMAVKGQGFARMAYVVDLDLMGAEPAKNDEIGVGELEAVYVVQLTDMREMLLDGIHVGDKFYEKTSKALMGEVIDVRIEEHEETQLGPDGITTRVKKENSWDLYVKLRGRAVEKPDGYYLDGGAELKVGASVTMGSQRFERTGVFYALESIEAVR
ncbi:MAG: DUF4330 domain-containing protein [Oscillospiraceae bacterium]|nr:DUF4330 domain-containing protein [Oscillospiraceae bacterium]